MVEREGERLFQWRRKATEQSVSNREEKRPKKVTPIGKRESDRRKCAQSRRKRQSDQSKKWKVKACLTNREEEKRQKRV